MNSIGRVIGCSDCDCDAPQPQRQAKQKARSHDSPSHLRNWDAGTHSGEDRFQISTGIPGHRDPSFNLAHTVTKAKRFPIPQGYIPPLGATQPLAADLQPLRTERDMHAVTHKDRRPHHWQPQQSRPQCQKSQVQPATVRGTYSPNCRTAQMINCYSPRGVPTTHQNLRELNGLAKRIPSRYLSKCRNYPRKLDLIVY